MKITIELSDGTILKSILEIDPGSCDHCYFKKFPDSFGKPCDLCDVCSKYDFIFQEV